MMSDGGMFHQTVRILAWLCVLAVIVLSLVPSSLRPHTMSSGRVEHFLAYAVAGLLFSLAYHSLRERVTIWVGLAAVSCALEALQNSVPGRSPSILDALASTSGLTFGLLLGAVASAYIVSP